MRLLKVAAAVCSLLFIAAQQDDKAKIAQQDKTKVQDPSKPGGKPQANKGGSKLLTAKGELLFPHPKDKIIFETMNVSDVGKISFVAKTKDGKERVYYQGKPQEPFNYIVPVDLLAAAQSLTDQQKAQLRASRGALSTLIKFTPNSERVFYTANTGAKFVIAGVDGFKSDPYDFVMDGMPVVSPDSKKIAFGVGQKGRWFVYLDKVPSKDMDDLQVGTIAFSPNSERLAFCGRKSSAWRVFTFDNVSYDALEGVAEGSPIFSPDSKHLAYVAFTKQNKNVVFWDGQPCGEFDAIGEKTPIFSPDSQHVAFAAKKQGKWCVQIDRNPPTEWYDAIAEGTPIYSKDSKHLVWAAQTGKEWHVYIDGKRLTEPAKDKKKKPEAISAEQILRATPTLSPDGKRMAFGMKRQGGWAIWEGTLDLSSVQESEKFDDIKDPSIRYTWDSQKIAFVGIRQGKFVPVINFKEFKECIDISPTRVSGNETSGTVAWCCHRTRTPEQVAEARKKDKDAGETYWEIMINGSDEYGPYNNVQAGALSVSWDGNRVAIPAQTRDGWGIWINGERRTDGLPIWIRFNPDTHLMEMIAVTAEGYMLVREVYE